MEKIKVIESMVVSNRGLIRKNNEDNFYFNNQVLEIKDSDSYSNSFISSNSEQLFAVCDGMGGQENGEEAASQVVNNLKKLYAKRKFKTNTIQERIYFINKFIMRINEYIYSLSKYNSFDRMGTTFVSLLIKNGTAVAINVGDSRAYLHRNNNIVQLSEDHTESQRLVKLGLITKENARKHVGRSYLSKYLGSSNDSGLMDGFISKIVTLAKDDIFLICSDGLTDMLNDRELNKILSSHKDMNKMAQHLLSSALNNGGKDNITFILVKVK